MKKVGFIIFLSAVFSSMAVPFVAHSAPLWSGCHNVTAVTDYRAYNGSVYLTISPRIAGCSYRLRVRPGFNHATDELAKSALSLGATALVSGKELMFYYDNATTACDVRIISLGGYAGQCK